MFVIGYSRSYCIQMGQTEFPNYYSEQTVFGAQLWPTRGQAERYIAEHAKREARYNRGERWDDRLGRYVYPSHGQIICELINRYDVRPATPLQILRAEYSAGADVGFWEAPIWTNKPWHNDSLYEAGGEDVRNHFARKDDSQPGLVGFYDGPAHIERQRLTWARPGRYLKKFFGHKLTAEQIEFWATYFITGVKPSIQLDTALAFAKTGAEIVQVYTDGPRSCMSGNNFSEDGNPTRVYGAGDLQVAYLDLPNWPAQWGEREFDGNVIARALVRPSTMTYGRIYPSPEYWRTDGFDSEETSREVRDLLEKQLRDLGYQSLQENRDGFNGAKMVRDHDGGDGCVVMPYLDSNMKFNVCDGHLEMHRSGEYSSESTGGYADIEEDSPSYEYECAECEEGFNKDDVSVVTYFYSSNRARHSTSTWCRNCADNNAFYCEGLEEYVSKNVSNRYEMSNGETWCEQHYELHGAFCEETDQYLPTDDMTVLASGEYVCDEWARDNCIQIDGDYHRKEDTFTCLYDGSTWAKGNESERFPGWPAAWDADDTITLQDRCAYGAPNCEAVVYRAARDEHVTGLVHGFGVAVTDFLENYGLEAGYCMAA